MNPPGLEILQTTRNDYRNCTKRFRRRQKADDAASAVLLEVPQDAATNKKVVLAGFAGIGQRKIRSTRPEVANLPANAETMPHSDIQTDATLQHSRRGGTPRIRPAEDESLIFAEMSKASAQAHPWGNRGRRK